MSVIELRIMLYSHNTRGMGHATRLVNIAWGLYECMPSASILCCTGGMYGLADLLPPNADFVKIPSYDATEIAGTFRLFPARLKVTRSRLASIRRNILTAVARSFSPHVLISDFTPLGKDRELEGAIRLIRRKPNRLIILGLRDILNDPERAGHFLNQEVWDPVREYFDRVFIYGDPLLYDFFTAYPIPMDLRPRLEAVGYLVNPLIARENTPNFMGKRDEKKIIAGVGGGKDALDILLVILGAWKQVQPLLMIPCTLHIVTGPYIRDLQLQQIECVAKETPGVKITRELPMLAKHLPNYNLFIGACGYNTFAEILQAGIRAIFLPRIQVDSKEQVIRAKQIQNDGQYEVIELSENAEQLLAQKILQILSQSTINVDAKQKIHLDGVTRVAGYIQNWWINRKTEE